MKIGKSTELCPLCNDNTITMDYGLDREGRRSPYSDKRKVCYNCNEDVIPIIQLGKYSLYGGYTFKTKKEAILDLIGRMDKEDINILKGLLK